MKNRKHVWDLALLSVFLVAAFVVGVTSTALNTKKNLSTTNTQAASPDCKCTDDDICYPDGCTRKPKTPQNTYDDARYSYVCDQYKPNWPPSSSYQQFYCGQHQPDCCSDMVQYQDSRLCCFMERWHCHPNYCNLLQGDKRDCGKYWGLPNGFSEYGCVKTDSNGDKVPKYGLAPNMPGGNQPTATPQPQPATSTPPPQQATATPTRPPNVPTSTPRPTTHITTVPTQTGVTWIPWNSPTPVPITPFYTPTPTHGYIGGGNTPTPTRTPTAGNGSQQNTPTPYEDDTIIGRIFPSNTPVPGSDPNNSDGSDIDTVPINDPNRTSQTVERDDGIAYNPVNETVQINLPVIPDFEVKTPKRVVQDAITFESIQVLQKNTEKPLGVVRTTFVTVKTYDQRLEVTIENFLRRIVRQVREIISPAAQ